MKNLYPQRNPENMRLAVKLLKESAWKFKLENRLFICQDYPNWQILIDSPSQKLGNTFLEIFSHAQPKYLATSTLNNGDGEIHSLILIELQDRNLAVPATSIEMLRSENDLTYRYFYNMTFIPYFYRILAPAFTQDFATNFNEFAHEFGIFLNN